MLNRIDWRTGLKNKPFIDVKEYPFNAKGDGITDDTAAIQAAVDALPTAGGTIVIPAGSYVISNNITDSGKVAPKIIKTHGATFVNTGSKTIFGATPYSTGEEIFLIPQPYFDPLGQSNKPYLYINAYYNESGTPNINGFYAFASVVHPGPNAGGNFVAIYGAIETGSYNNGAQHTDIWGLNTVCNWRAGDPDVNVVGYELDLNNFNSDTFSALKHGFAAVNGYLYKTGIGISVATSIPGTTGLWRNAAVFLAFSDVGIVLGGSNPGAYYPSTSPINLLSRQDASISDNIVLQRYSDTVFGGYFLRILNAANSVNLLTWDNQNNVNFNDGSLGLNAVPLTITGSILTLTDTSYMATPPKSVVLTNGLNNNIVLSGAEFVKILGPTGVFSLTGFAARNDGSRLEVFNASAQEMTIVNQSASSSVGNRILTLTGADVILRPSFSFASFVYDVSGEYWLLKAYN